MTIAGQCDNTQSAGSLSFSITRAASGVIVAKIGGTTPVTLTGTSVFDTTHNFYGSSFPWDHVAVVRAGNVFTLYLNGFSEATSTTSTTVNASTNNLAIGRPGGFNGQYWNGNIDEFHFARRALWTANFHVNGFTLNYPYGTIDGLYNAADNYASGIPVNITSALNFVDTDVRGLGAVGNGDPSNLLGLIPQYQEWETMVATYDGLRTRLPIVNYEGGFQCRAPLSDTLTAIGVDTTYVTKIFNLFEAYKNDARCKQLVLDQLHTFMSYPHSQSPGWYEYVCDGNTGGQSQWSTHPGDLYSTPYQTYFAMVTFDTCLETPPPAPPPQHGHKGHIHSNIDWVLLH